MTRYDMQEWLRFQVETQRASHVYVVGTHSIRSANSPETEVIDFDFELDASNLIQLVMFEVTMSDDQNKVVMIVAESDQHDERLLEQCLAKVDGIIGQTHNRVRIDHKITNRESMTLSLQDLARKARYGGRLRVKCAEGSAAWPHEKTDVQEATPTWIHVEAIWKHKGWSTQAPDSQGQSEQLVIRPGPRPMDWGQRIQHAMVDGERGLITLEDQIERHAPFIKAMRKHGLYEPLQNNGPIGTGKIHLWGQDEADGDTAFVGYPHFTTREAP